MLVLKNVKQHLAQITLLLRRVKRYARILDQRRSEANGVGDVADFPLQEVSAGDTENRYVQLPIARGVLSGSSLSGYGKIRPYGNENGVRVMRLHPGKLFHRNGEDGDFAGVHGLPHGVELRAVAQPINQTRSGEWLDVVIDNGNARSNSVQCAQHARNPQRKSARRP